jgi:hypothetical protein
MSTGMFHVHSPTHRHTGESRYPLCACLASPFADAAVDPGAGEARPVLSLPKGRDDMHGEVAI